LDFESLLFLDSIAFFLEEDFFTFLTFLDDLDEDDLDELDDFFFPNNLEKNPGFFDEPDFDELDFDDLDDLGDLPKLNQLLFDFEDFLFSRLFFPFDDPDERDDQDDPDDFFDLFFLDDLVLCAFGFFIFIFILKRPPS